MFVPGLRRKKQKDRTLRQVQLANLQGQELEDWFDLAGRTLTRGTEATLQVMSTVRDLMAVVAPERTDVLAQINRGIADLRKMVDRLSIVGPNGKPVPFGLIRNRREMDAALEHSLGMMGQVTSRADGQLSALQQDLEANAAVGDVNEVVRLLSIARAKIGHVTPNLRRVSKH